MYGFIHCALQDLVRRYYDEETWKKILLSAEFELDGGSFLIHRVYTDEETLRLVKASSIVLELPIDDILEKFGEHFFFYCRQSGYDRILKVLGRNLKEFLCNLDALHDHLASIYPGMKAPSFRTTNGENGSLLLHYYSHRKGLERIVIGIVKAVAEQLLSTTLSVEVQSPKSKQENNNDKNAGNEIDELISTQNVDHVKTDSNDHIVFIINEIKSKSRNERLHHLTVHRTYPATDRFKPSSVTPLQINKSTSNPLVLCHSFCDAFPFHIVFNRDLIITQAGIGISRYLRRNGTLSVSGETVYFTDAFDLVRPKMDFNFKMVLAHINTVFILETHTEKKDDCNNILDPMSNRDISGLRLKGQMIYMKDKDAIMFLCSPRPNSMSQLKDFQMSLHDIPLHDATRELLLAAHVHRSSRELVHKLEESTNSLRKLKSRLIDDKSRTDNLLHEILPKKVALKLRLNKPVEAERHKLVTVLFSDIVGFTALCSDENVVPMDIVHLLNKLYTYFDLMSGVHDIYKVETIGDAYMVVGGLPIKCDDHAERIAEMAVDMIQIVEDVHSPVDLKPISIRIGIHSGSVMAGVVGMKMPRYCLFGATVNIANKMESTGEPGGINVSAETKRYLTKSHWSFTPNTRCASLPCYLLKRNPIEPALQRIVEIKQKVAEGQVKCTMRFIRRTFNRPSMCNPEALLTPSVKQIKPRIEVEPAIPSICPMRPRAKSLVHIEAVKEDSTRY